MNEKDAKDIVDDILPTIRKGIEAYGKANMRITDIENRYDAVRREGNTPDVFCKIAGAAIEHGIIADIDMTKSLEMIMTFSPAKKPSPENCEKKWQKVKNLIEWEKRQNV
jgi:hypothetical protein